MERKFTGRHMVIWMVTFFGVVIAVNVAMARLAISSFGGVVVENSYVASQHFNGWLDQARAQEQLGWQVTSTLQSDRRLALHVTGVPADAVVTVVARHPLGRQPDRTLTFANTGAGALIANESLPDGRWTVRIAIAAAGQTWRREDAVQ